MVTTERMMSTDINLPIFRRADTLMKPFDWREVSRAERLLEPEKLVRRIVPRCSAKRRHAIFKMPGPTTVYIPAFLMIQLLFRQSIEIASRLWVPNGAAMLCHGIREDDTMKVVAHRRIGKKLSPAEFRTLAWLNAREDARRSYASVLRYARAGEINLDLPDFRLSAWVWGIELDCGIFCAELNGTDLHLPIGTSEILARQGSKEELIPSFEPRVRSMESRFYGKSQDEIESILDELRER